MATPNEYETCPISYVRTPTRIIHNQKEAMAVHPDVTLAPSPPSSAIGLGADCLESPASLASSVASDDSFSTGRQIKAARTQSWAAKVESGDTFAGSDLLTEGSAEWDNFKLISLLDANYSFPSALSALRKVVEGLSVEIIAQYRCVEDHSSRLEQCFEKGKTNRLEDKQAIRQLDRNRLSLSELERSLSKNSKLLNPRSDLKPRTKRSFSKFTQDWVKDDGHLTEVADNAPSSKRCRRDESGLINNSREWRDPLDPLAMPSLAPLATLDPSQSAAIDHKHDAPSTETKSVDLSRYIAENFGTPSIFDNLDLTSVLENFVIPSRLEKSVFPSSTSAVLFSQITQCVSQLRDRVRLRDVELKKQHRVIEQVMNREVELNTYITQAREAIQVTHRRLLNLSGECCLPTLDPSADSPILKSSVPINSSSTADPCQLPCSVGVSALEAKLDEVEVRYHRMPRGTISSTIVSLTKRVEGNTSLEAQAKKTSFELQAEWPATRNDSPVDPDRKEQLDSQGSLEVEVEKPLTPSEPLVDPGWREQFEITETPEVATLKVGTKVRVLDRLLEESTRLPFDACLKDVYDILDERRKRFEMMWKCNQYVARRLDTYSAGYPR
jgi:hypothetical protein